MFNKTDDDSMLDSAIRDIFAQMAYQAPDSDEYAKMVSQVSTLYSLKEINKPKRVSPDTLATIAANLAGIMMIIGHERIHVVTSKALNFIPKLR